MAENKLSRCRIETPLGEMVAVARGGALVMLEFADRRKFDRQEAAVHRHTDAEIVDVDSPVFDQVRLELEEYFHGTRKAFTIPLVFLGTPFQIEVWEYLARIPFGQTATYGQIAQFMGRKELTRAVGRANGDNRLAIVVPCHRVIAADGDLCGYAGGLGRKQWLLALESGQPALL